MIEVYGNNCLTCRQVRKILDGNNVPYTYHDVTGKTLEDLKEILGDDYEPGLYMPIVYENGVYIINIRAFIRRHNKKRV